jgi:hypothetical protein
MSEYKPIEACTSVAELLADPERWTKGKAARNENGKRVKLTSHKAQCWCVSGAIGRIYANVWDKKRSLERLAAAAGVPHRHFIAGWNDAPERTHAEVLEAVRKAGI